MTEELHPSFMSTVVQFPTAAEKDGARHGWKHTPAVLGDMDGVLWMLLWCHCQNNQHGLERVTSKGSATIPLTYRYTTMSFRYHP